MFEFSDRVAVITGGASGIGLGLASKLADEGMKIVLADIESAVLERACESLRSSGADVLGVQCDVSDKAQVEALAITAYEHFGCCLLYTSPSPRDPKTSRMPSSA